MALQPFVEPWPLFQLLDLLHSRWDSFDGGSARRKAATCAHRTAQTQNKRTQTFMSQVGFEPTIPVFERAKTVHALDRASTVMGLQITISVSKKDLVSGNDCIIVGCIALGCTQHMKFVPHKIVHASWHWQMQGETEPTNINGKCLALRPTSASTESAASRYVIYRNT
jgi:hypothetical protein